jgi:SAM-dependent methyltransferase
MHRCHVCRSDRIERILDLGPQSVASHFAATPSTHAILHHLALAFCQDCGIVQIAEPFPARDLLPPHDWISYREPESHLDAAVERICGLAELTKSASVAGISAKDRTTLARLHARGFDKLRVLDPRPDLGAASPHAGVESVQALLTPQKAEEIVARCGPFDLVVARHIAEHAEEPWRFMRALAALLAPNGHLVLEIPDCSANLARQDYAMIWEEHVLYLTAETAPHLLAAAGCTEISRDAHSLPFEDVIVLIGRKSDRPARPHIADEVGARHRDLAHRFGAAFDEWTHRIDRVLCELTRDGRRLAAYGAGHLTCAFLDFHDVAHHFAFVVDDTPQKHGLFLPKSKLPIVPRQQLDPRTISACLFGLSPQLEDRIIAGNAAYTDRGGRFYSMLADSSRSIRRLM